MLKSMTGWGTSCVSKNGYSVSSEVRSVNHRYLDISFRTQPNFSLPEEDLRKLMQARLKRGKVQVNVTLEKRAVKDIFFVDWELAGAAVSTLRQIQKKFRLRDDIALRDVLGVPGVMRQQESGAALHALNAVVREAVDKAVARLERFRVREGRTAERSIRKHLGAVREELRKIKKRIPLWLRSRRENVSRKLQEAGGNPKNGNFLGEVEIMCQKSDISEEVSRIEAHCDAFDRCMASTEAAGRQMDFLCQELHRESTTIASKTGDNAVSEHSVKMRSELEKVREQVQNVE